MYTFFLPITFRNSFPGRQNIPFSDNSIPCCSLTPVLSLEQTRYVNSLEIRIPRGQQLTTTSPVFRNNQCNVAVVSRPL